MRNYINKGHLRLVSSNIAEDREMSPLIGSLTREELAQKTNGSLLILIKEEEILRNDEFLGILEDTAPAWIFDLRISPRLDIVAPNRLLAFNIFSSLGINYVDLAGLNRDNQNRQNNCSGSWFDFVVSKLQEASSDQPVCIFLFDGEDALSRAMYYIKREILSVRILENSVVSRFRPKHEFLLSM